MRSNCTRGLHMDNYLRARCVRLTRNFSMSKSGQNRRSQAQDSEPTDSRSFHSTKSKCPVRLDEYKYVGLRRFRARFSLISAFELGRWIDNGESTQEAFKLQATEYRVEIAFANSTSGELEPANSPSQKSQVQQLRESFGGGAGG